jgi:hypothetical protein
MPSVSLINSTVCVAFSPLLTASCTSQTFWTAHQRAYNPNLATVDYPVTVHAPGCVFTTALSFYVCDGLPWDAVLGQDFLEACSQASGTLHNLHSSI